MVAPETIVFPDVEAALKAWLDQVLPSYSLAVPVSTQVPNPRPDRFFRFLRVGGLQDSLVVDAAMVTVEAWNVDPVAAAQDAQLLRAILKTAVNVTAPTGALIYQVTESAAPGWDPDPSGHPRYSWTVEVHTRGHAI